jgi:hypothetical protein
MSSWLPECRSGRLERGSSPDPRRLPASAAKDGPGEWMAPHDCVPLESSAAVDPGAECWVSVPELWHGHTHGVGHLVPFHAPC